MQRKCEDRRMGMERHRLIAVRLKKHWAQAEAARRIGVNAATLCRWEQGRSMPNLYNIQQLCKAYDVSSAELDLDPSDNVIETPTTKSIDDLNEIQAFIQQDLTMRLIALAYENLCDSQTLQDTMAATLEEHTAMQPKALITRREALSRLTTLPVLTLGLAPNIVSSNAQRNVIPTLNQCAAGIAAARELIKSQKSEDLALAYQAVSAYLPTLRAIMQESSQHRKTAANLAAQCARLRSAIGRIGWHSENLKQAEIYAQQAVAYAQESGDSALLISAILSQAWAYYYDRRCAEGVAVIARTIPLLKQNDVPRSLAARVLSTQAVLQARNGQTSSSSESLRKAHSVVNKLTDDYYAFTDTVIIEMTGNEGMAHYHAGNYDRALDTFTQLIDDSSLASKKLLSGKGRVEMLNFMALSELKSPKRDMDKTISFWQTGLEGAKALQSKQRFNESLAIYDMMEAVWPGERRIAEFRDLTNWQSR